MAAKLGSGEKFKAMSETVAMSYMKKGKGKEKAIEIGKAVAAKAGMKKYGKKKMTQMAVKGKKRG